MIAPSTPLPLAATTPAQPATVPSASPSDFLAMLGQMIGAPAAPVAGQALIAALPGVAAKDEEPVATTDAQALAALGVPLPVAPTVPAAGQGSTGRDVQLIAAADPRSTTTVASQALFVTDMIDGELQSASDDLASFDAMPPLLSPEAQATSRTSAAGTDALLSRPIHHPVGSKQWGDEVNTRVTMMAEAGKHTASLRLSPEHLGPLEIRIAIQDDQASVWFGAAHADTRAAIETALPRLRDMFDAQGISLTDAGVFREPPRQQTPTAQQSATGTLDGAPGDGTEEVAVSVKLGLVDDYA